MFTLYKMLLKWLFQHSWLNKKKSISKEDLMDLNIEMMSGETMKAIVKRVLKLYGEEREGE